MTRTQNAQIAAAVQAALAIVTNGASQPKKAKGRKGRGQVKLSDEQKTKNAAENARVAEEAFAKAGFKDNKANVTIKTYGRPAKDGKPATGWLAVGRRVREGEKSLKHPTKGYPLFHISQTEVESELPQTAQSTDTVQ